MIMLYMSHTIWPKVYGHPNIEPNCPASSLTLGEFFHTKQGIPFLYEPDIVKLKQERAKLFGQS